MPTPRTYGDGTIWQGSTQTGKTVWFVEITIGHHLNGRPRKVRRQAATRAAAVRVKQDLLSDKNRGISVHNSQKTLGEYALWWVREVKPSEVRPATAGDYESRLRRYVLPFIGKTRVSEVSYQQLVEWMNDLRARGYTANTINGARTILHQVIKNACREGILSGNPVALTSPMKRHIGDPTQVQPAWTREEAIHVIDRLRGHELELFSHLCLKYGLRHGEALGLRWDCVDLERNEIHIRHTLREERRLLPDGRGVVRQVLYPTKTKSSNRVLPISDSLREVLDRHKMNQSLKKQIAQDKWNESGHVITSSIGTTVSQSNMRRYRDRFLKAEGIRIIRVHDMRHSFAEITLEAGVPLEATSQSLGHSDTNITKKIYAPNVRGMNKVAIDGMDNFLGGKSHFPSEWVRSNIEPITPTPLRITQPVRVGMQGRATPKKRGS